MRPIAWMVTISVISWLAAAIVVERQTSVEVLWGMLGPLVVAIGTWLAVERAKRQKRESLIPLMVAAFAGKMVFFGAYVAVMLRVLRLRPAPFVISFTGFFIILYLMEALYLRRLFSGRMHASQ
ncbi:MAG: hypothetical protein DMG12_12165 [Acidobacteria bacterium]|nr:MAG: hypothetical protein DMG12_12165 [Acidobacteriota bacterium]